MEQLTYERLQENLKRLKLSRAAEILDTVVAQSEKNDGSYLSFLDHLLEEEVAAKEKSPYGHENRRPSYGPNHRRV